MTTITLQDGTKLEVSAGFVDKTPGAQQLEIQEKLNEQNVQAQVQKSRQDVEKNTATVGDYLAGVPRAALGQGLLLGFGDELEAGLRTGFGLLGDYGKTVEGIREDISDFQSQAPGVAIGSEIAGAVAPALLSGLFTGGTGGAAVGGTTAARIAARGANLAKKAVAPSTRPGLMGNVVTGAKQGAVYGGAYGAGKGEGNVFERLDDAAAGAALGAGTGAVLQPVMTGVVSGAGKIKDVVQQQMGNTDAAKRFANRKILSAMQDDLGDDAIKVAQNMDNPGLTVGANKNQAVPNTIADLGENTQSLGYVAQSTKNPTRNKVAEQLDDRFEDQSDRLLGDLINTSKADDYLSPTYLDDVIAKQKAAAKENYAEAYKVDVDGSKFKDAILPSQKKYFVEANQKAKELAKLDGDEAAIAFANKFEAEDGFEAFFNQPHNTRYLHYLKQGFDDMIDQRTTPVPFGADKVDAIGVRLQGVRKKFNDVIKENNSGYKSANANFADKVAVQDAYKLGESLKGNTTFLKQSFAKMNDGEKEAFRAGVLNHMANKLERTNFNRDTINQFVGNQKIKDTLRLLYPDGDEGEKAYNAFLTAAKAERQMAQTRNKVKSGSPTEMRQEARREFNETGNFLIDAVTNPLGAASNLARAGVNKVVGFNNQRAAEVASKLFTRSADEQQAVLKELAKENEVMAREVARLLAQTQQAQKAAQNFQSQVMSAQQ